MPQIKSYIQQVATPAGFNTSSRNPSVEGGEARGLQRIGSAIQDVGQVLNEVQQNKEVAEGSAKLADLRLKYSQRIVQEAEAGSINPEKIDEDFENELSQIQSSYSTAGGVDYVRRNGTEIKSSIKGSVFAAQTELTKVKLKEDVDSAVDKATQLLRLDPTQRESAYTQMNDMLDNLSMGGRPLDAKIKEKMRSQISRSIDVAQFRGLIANARTEDLPKLRDALRTTAFLDRNFDDDTVRSLEKEAMSEFSWRETETVRARRSQEDADKARQEALMNKAYVDFEAGKLSYDEVKKLDLSFDNKERLKNIIKTDNTREVTVNDSHYAKSLLTDVLSGTITDPAVITDYYTDNKIKKTTMHSLIKQMNFYNRPEIAPYKQAVKGLESYAEENLTKDPFLGRDPEGRRQLQLFKDEMARVMMEKQNQGVPMSELLDPEMKSKDSLYFLVGKFKRSQEEVINSITGNIGGAARPPKPKDSSGKELSDDEIIKKVNNGEL